MPEIDAIRDASNPYKWLRAQSKRSFKQRNDDHSGANRYESQPAKIEKGRQVRLSDNDPANNGERYEYEEHRRP